MQGVPQPTEEEQATARAGNLLGLDPPEHSRLRRMLTPEFTIRRMKRLEPRIVEIVDAQLDAMENAGPPVDLVENFALPIPSLVICELLGVPYDDREDFQRRSVRQLDLSIPIPERLELQRQGRAYMTTLVSRARRQPGEDILGMLVREHGDELTDDELDRRRGPAVARRATRPRRTCWASARWRCCVTPNSSRRCVTTPTPSGPRSRSCCAGFPSCRPRSPASPPPTSRSPGVKIPAGKLVFPSLPSGNRDAGLHRLT